MAASLVAIMEVVRLRLKVDTQEAEIEGYMLVVVVAGTLVEVELEGGEQRWLGIKKEALGNCLVAMEAG